MQVEWYGQSAFRLDHDGVTVVIDPFGDVSRFTSQGLRWDYPPITGVSADLVLITHEHRDHNAVEVVRGDPVVLRSTAGTLDSPIGEVVAIASEHDDVAGTKRGPNTIFAFTFAGLRVAHFGDFGQAALRPEQAAALGTVDVLFVPVGGGPTIGAQQAHAIAAESGATTIVPMHYRTERVSFLEPVDAFADAAKSVHRVGAPVFDVAAGGMTRVVIPSCP